MSDSMPIIRSSWLDDGARERFWAKVDKLGPLPDLDDPLISAPQTPCWVWTAARVNGYGRFTPPMPMKRGKTGIASRISFMELVGPVADGVHIDHLCRNTACVNPEHLEAVTQRENLLRGATVTAARAATKHCPQGHAYTEANTWVSPKRQRSCRECHRIRENARRANDPELRANIARKARAYRARIRDLAASALP